MRRSFPGSSTGLKYYIKITASGTSSQKDTFKFVMHQTAAAPTTGSMTRPYWTGATLGKWTMDIDKANDVAASSHTDDVFAYQGLYHAIDGLGMSERTAVLLFYMEDRSVKEIATMMNVAEGTVKAYLSRGREHLRNKLTNNQSRQI